MTSPSGATPTVVSSATGDDDDQQAQQALADAMAAGDDADAGDGADGTDDAGSDQLGDAGKQALDRMKGQRNAARDELRAFKALGLTPEQIAALTAPKDGDQPDPEKIRRDAEAEATRKANSRIIRSEIRAAAAGKLADPADALAYLDMSRFEVDDDGEVDQDEVAEAIDDLLKKKPYLAAQGRPRFQGDADGGPRNRDQADGKPLQVTEDQLKTMTPDEIVAAQKEGKLADLLGG